ncbi:MAG: hypothetical protein SGCHY_003051 [Lobulomycetales sp.]
MVESLIPQALALSLSDQETRAATTSSVKSVSSTTAVKAPASPEALFSVRAVYDFPGAAEQGELALARGDVVLVYDNTTFQDWWKGKLNGQIGIFPQNYVERLPPQGPAETLVGGDEQVIANAGPVIDRFLYLLGSVDPNRSISEQTEFQNTYQQILNLRPMLARLLHEKTEKHSRMIACNERFMKACTSYHRLMDNAMAQQQAQRAGAVYHPPQPPYSQQHHQQQHHVPPGSGYSGIAGQHQSAPHHPQYQERE